MAHRRRARGTTAWLAPAVGAFVLASLASKAAPAAAGDPSAIAALPDPEARAAALGALAERDAGAAPTLASALLYDPAPLVRAAAAAGLGRVRALPYRSLLEIAAERDPDPAVRRAAAAALGELWPLTRSPGRAVLFSTLCPGCGHFYLRRPGTALALLGATGGLVGGGLALARGESVNIADPDAPGASSWRAPVALQLLMAGQNLWFYGIFAAYRDARALRADLGYRHPVSDETLGKLALAPFSPRVLSRRWFWAGLPAAFAAALGVSLLMDGDDLRSGRRTLFDGGGVNFLGRRHGTGAGFALGELYWGALFFPVGVGEEALFRGVVQPSLTESLGPRGGLAAASVVFGAVHAPNFWAGDADSSTKLKRTLVGVPFITALGAYLGLVSQRSEGRLATSVALHFWYDFLLGTADFIADPDRQPFVVRVGFPY